MLALSGNFPCVLTFHVCSIGSPLESPSCLLGAIHAIGLSEPSPTVAAIVCHACNVADSVK
jgi:hypothetical protein